MIEKVLQEIGLTQNEIKIYLALLDLGESKIGDILSKSKLNSGKIYENLESLQNKGLASFVVKNKVKYFSPADPKRVLDYLHNKQNTLKSQEEDYKDILPELLKRISVTSPKSKIEIFTGNKGLRTAYAKELEFPKSETLYIQSVNSSNEYSKHVWNFFIHDHQPKRQLKGYIIKKLLAEEARSETKHHEKNAEIKFLPYGSLVSINIIGNLTTIGIFSEEPIFLSIESQEVADNFKNQFELLWKTAKR